MLGLGGAGVGGGGEGGALVVAEVVLGVNGGSHGVGVEEVVGGVEGVVEKGRAILSVGEVVPVKVGSVVIAGQNEILLLGLVEVMVAAPIEMDHGQGVVEGGGGGRGGGGRRACLG